MGNNPVSEKLSLVQKTVFDILFPDLHFKKKFANLQDKNYKPSTSTALPFSINGCNFFTGKKSNAGSTEASSGANQVNEAMQIDTNKVVY